MSENILYALDVANQKLALSRERMRQIETDKPRLQGRLVQLETAKRKYDAIDALQEPVDALNDIGADELFWGEAYPPPGSKEQAGRLRQLVEDFNSELEQARRQLEQSEVEYGNLITQVSLLDDEVLALREIADAARDRVIVEWARRDPPRHTPVMPWSGEREDNGRYRKVLLGVTVTLLLLASLITGWELPVLPQTEPELPDERYVQLITQRKEVVKAVVPEAKTEEAKPEEKQEELKKDVRERVQNTGVLAFSKDLDALLGPSEFDTSSSGATPLKRNVITTKGRSGTASRKIDAALLTSDDLPGSSSDRQVARTEGELRKITFTKVESDVAEAEGGVAAFRTPASQRSDEEIQLVFDRYKASLYRIYIRELRANPLLRGQLVLRISIEPDGSVSDVVVDSTDIDAGQFVQKILERVGRFNFGPKPDSARLTIRYPIDFLPVN